MAYKKRRNYETTSYSIAHYILMFILVCACIVIVAWILIADRHHEDTDATGAIFTEQTITSNGQISPCAQKVINTVAQMWTYNPDQIPARYWDIASHYVNGNVTERTEGTCDKVKYICYAGQRRRDCNPCAVQNGIAMAMDRHAADLISKKCPK